MISQTLSFLKNPISLLDFLRFGGCIWDLGLVFNSLSRKSERFGEISSLKLELGITFRGSLFPFGLHLIDCLILFLCK